MPVSIRNKTYAVAGAALCVAVAVGAWLQHGSVQSFFYLADDDTRAFLGKTLFRVGGRPVRIFFLLKTLLFLIFLNLLSRAADMLLVRLTRHSPRIDQHREYILSKVVTLSIYLIGLLIWVDVEGINLRTFVVLGGALGVGLGLGVQTFVSNLVAGVVLLLEQPIRLGDRIEFGDKAGEVIRVGGRSSWLRTYDHAILIVPNSELLTKQILNWSAGDPKTRVVMAVSVAYRTDVERAMQVLLEVARNHADVLDTPAPGVVLVELAPNAINFNLRVWTLLKADAFMELRSQIWLQILRRFSEEKISIPFPQLDLHVQPAANTLPATAITRLQS